MKKSVCLILILIVFSVVSFQFVLADTTVTVRVNPNSEIVLNLLNPFSLEAYQSFVINSSETGLATCNTSITPDKVAVSMIVRKNGKIVQNIKPADYGNFTMGGTIYIDTLLATTPTTPPATTPAATTPNVTNTTPATTPDTPPATAAAVNSSNNSANESASFISGIVESVKSWDFGYILKIVAYIVGGVVIIFIILFIIYKIREKKAFYSPKAFKPKSKDSSGFGSGFRLLGVGGSGDLSSAEKRIRAAQEEIKRAQEEINKIKNQKSEIKQAEEKFLQAKKDLERLKGEKI